MSLVLLKKADAGYALSVASFHGMRDAFGDYVHTLRSAAASMSDDELLDRLGDLPWDDAEKQLLQDWKNAAVRGLEDGADLGLPQIGLPSDDEALARVFALDNPYAIDWMDDHGARFVREISNAHMLSLREILRRGIADGKTVRNVAREIKQGIGLTDRGYRALENYRLQLEAMELSTTEINYRVNRYQDRLLRDRSLNIARTESAYAVEEGRLDSWRIAKQNGFVADDGAFKQWITAWDERTCSICGPMHNETVPVDQLYSNGGMAPPAHSQCRCTSSFVFMAPGSKRRPARRPSNSELEALSERRKIDQKKKRQARRKFKFPKTLKQRAAK